MAGGIPKETQECIVTPSGTSTSLRVLVTTVTGSSCRVSSDVNGIDFGDKCNHLARPSSVILIFVPMAWHLFSAGIKLDEQRRKKGIALNRTTTPENVTGSRRAGLR
ncbi:uncharacterized protein F4807DRAFT_464613 [Annulohypoxylon truncatum]|uniref:uncharacterized protein n=1 Tax=Annulohypoxylon truncatum TaxID=327061 RepID=UPI0020082660|nr:uncharacterized protein F4807DRAFT_464613 [Annulohypoxylon truncatum]KAI1205527.1 hypothetical protein F4807DRAFT_464613 [Annulohypoxylon truncatum]